MGLFVDTCISANCGVSRVAGTEVSFSGVDPETLPFFLALSNQSIPSLSCARQSLGTFRDRLDHPWNKTQLFRRVFQCLPGVKAIESSAFMERAMGIELYPKFL